MDVDIKSFNHPKELSIAPSKWYRELADAENAPLIEPIETYGIAGRIWEAAHDFTQYCKPPSYLELDPPCPLMHSSSELHETKTIIELGSGTGIVGLFVAGLLDPGDLVILTDLPEVLPLLEENTRIAQSQLATSSCAETWIRSLSWGDQSAVQKIEEELLESSRSLSHIICSDLVYFPHLLAPLLRSLIHLTSGRQSDPEIIISCMIRDLTRETPFWAAFGAWFDFYPVLARQIPAGRGAGLSISGNDGRDQEPWERFGSNGESFVFIGRRKRTTKTRKIEDESDSKLMSITSDSFESLLQLMLE